LVVGQQGNLAPVGSSVCFQSGATHPVFDESPCSKRQGIIEVNKTMKYLNRFLIVLTIAGCVAWPARYGKIRYFSGGGNEVTIQALIENWEAYHIYYAGLGVRLPLGIMFDPKNNDTTLVGDRWKIVENQQTLLEITRWIYPNTQYEPRLSKILGPDDQLYGYLYHSYGSVVLKLIDDRKIYVYNLEEPIEEGLGETLP
jgi:hypothetical protein